MVILFDTDMNKFDSTQKRYQWCDFIFLSLQQ
jgi:hypothetical protein